MLTGGCDCGAVRFEITGEVSPITVCHCKQCRRYSGLLWGSVRVPDDQFRYTKGKDAVTWHASSDWARRGFCSTCGAQLFYRMNDAEDYAALAVGAIDEPHGLAIGEHIFVKDKAPYVTIGDDAPQFDRD